MTRFVIFENAARGITAIPVEKTSRSERELILEAGGQIVEAGEVPAEAACPRGTILQYKPQEFALHRSESAGMTA